MANEVFLIFEYVAEDANNDSSDTENDEEEDGESDTDDSIEKTMPNANGNHALLFQIFLSILEQCFIICFYVIQRSTTQIEYLLTF